MEYSVPECFVAHHNLNTFGDLVTLFTSPLYSTAKISHVNPHPWIARDWSCGGVNEFRKR
jgi:hypothetical protein